jgi:hypothetical protein
MCAIQAVSLDPALMTVARLGIWSDAAYYVLEALIPEFKYPPQVAKARVMSLFLAVRDGTEEEVACSDVVGLREWKGGAIHRPLMSFAGAATETTFVVPARTVFRLFLEKNKGAHHHLALMGLLSLIKGPLTLHDAEDSRKLNPDSLQLRDAAAPGFNRHSGTATPAFRLWTNADYFAGQNVTSGGNAGLRANQLRDGFHMTGHTIAGVRDPADVFGEYMRLMRERGYVITDTMTVPGKKVSKALMRHVDRMSHEDLNAIIDRAGREAYSDQVRKAMHSIHKIVKRKFGGREVDDESCDESAPLRPRKRKQRKFKRVVPDDLIVLSSSDDDDAAPPTKKAAPRPPANSPPSSSSSSSSDDDDEKTPPPPVGKKTPPPPPPPVDSSSSDDDDEEDEKAPTPPPSSAKEKTPPRRDSSSSSSSASSSESEEDTRKPPPTPPTYGSHWEDDLPDLSDVFRPSVS